MIPVYQYRCTTWSDGEEHPEEDHNAYYDFQYLLLAPGAVVATYPEGIVMRARPGELEDVVALSIRADEAIAFLTSCIIRSFEYRDVVARAIADLKRGAFDGFYHSP